MKKLMTIAAVVFSAVTMQAAVYNWDCGAGEISLAGGKGLIEDGAQIYLFNASTLSQQSMITQLFVDKTATFADLVSSYAADKVGVATSDGYGGFVEAVNYAWGNSGDEWNAYYAVLAKDGNLLISEPQLTSVSELAAGSDIYFDEPTFSTAEAITTGTYAGEGWYGAVPEPTSGLLLLLGVAGLALRRRRA